MSLLAYNYLDANAAAGVHLVYVAVFLLLFAAAARAGQPPQETTWQPRAPMPPHRKNLFGAPYRRPLTGFSRAPITSAPLRLSVFRKPTLFILWTIAPALKDPRIKVYGWVNPGISVSTSNKSNIPESYAIVPNH